MGNETNAMCQQYELSPEQKEFLNSYDWWIEMFGKLPIEITGVFLNLTAFLVLSISSMKSNFFNRLLSILAIFDSIYLLCEISEVLRHQYHTSGQTYMCIYFTYPFRHVFMCSSIFMTIALALERYEALTNPVEYRNRGSTNITKRLLYYVLPILTFSLLYYIPKFLELNVDEAISCMNDTSTSITPIDKEVVNIESAKYVNCTREYHLIPTELRINHHYVLWYINVSNIIITAITPVVALGLLNFRIHASLTIFIKKRPSAGNETRNHDNDVKRTFIQFSIVTIFIVCHTLRILLNIDQLLNLNWFKEMLDKGCLSADRLWFRIVAPISQTLIIINASGNFFIYSFFDRTFQNVLNQDWIYIKNLTQRNRGNDGGQRENPSRHNITSRTNPEENIELLHVNHEIMNTNSGP